ncbi:hypothetical protein RRF57_013358 [Xylaria bambusicola]|uniref:Uncharacterized protein n=1 Tax=Xylaria bambusicola TaxID=326684 RepID=A0AAN7ZFE8_9PEZI
MASNCHTEVVLSISQRRIPGRDIDKGIRITSRETVLACIWNDISNALRIIGVQIRKDWELDPVATDGWTSLYRHLGH